MEIIVTRVKRHAPNKRALNIKRMNSICLGALVKRLSMGKRDLCGRMKSR